MSAYANNTNKKFRIVHYLNQFFGGLGGEEKADITPAFLEGAKGPGRLLEKIFKDQKAEIEIVATVVCGDSYFAEKQEEALREIIPGIQRYRPDLVIAGPAFNAGRYGMACGAICSALNQRGLPAITAMYKENPGVDQYRQSTLIVECADTVSGMEDAVRKMVRLGQKILKGEEIESPRDEGCLEQGLRKNYFHAQPACSRALNLLLQKIKGEPFETEYPLPFFDRVEPRPALADLKGIKIALVTSGGIVPAGNPDHIESSNASKYGKYSLKGIDQLEARTHQSAHGGYDNTYSNKDPNRVLPLDMMRELEKELGFKLYEWYYATVGNGTSVDSAQKFAKEIAPELIRDGVQAVVLTSTWGTCTRCGATMAKEIERAGIPVAHICSIITISQTVGANRIIPAVAIPHPLGNPKLSPEEEKELRRKLLKKAFKALQTPIKEQTVFAD